jgi:hypothetical protein
LLLGLFAVVEAANFTGFSWMHLRRLSDAELIDAAIQRNYPGISNQAELKRYYSSFEPEVTYWSDLTGQAGSQLLNKLVGLKLFQVRLPDAVVIVASDGKPRSSQPCGENKWCSPEVPPDHPMLGIVGTVQDGPPDYPAARQFTVRWEGSDGTVFVSGHCFAAFSTSPRPVLRISAPFNQHVITIGEGFGYRLVVIKDIKRAGYSSGKITEQEFEQSRTCDEKVRAAWPNVGGASWKR